MTSDELKKVLFLKFVFQDWGKVRAKQRGGGNWAINRSKLEKTSKQWNNTVW